MSTQRARIKNHPTRRLADLTIEPTTYSGGETLGLMLALRQPETEEARRHYNGMSALNLDATQMVQLRDLLNDLIDEYPGTFNLIEQEAQDFEARQRAKRITELEAELRDLKG